MVAIIAPERLVRDVAPDLTGHSEAVFNESRTHRYLLVRRWMPGRRLTFLMLNPSTAGATEDDPTLRRCAGFARREGYAAVALVNLFALIAVSPRDLRCHPDPVGPRNDEFIRGHCRPGWTVVAAWGAHGALSRRAAVVTADLLARGVNLCCLGTTKAGEPRHPLYLPAATPLMPFRAPAGSDPATEHEEFFILPSLRFHLHRR